MNKDQRHDVCWGSYYGDNEEVVQNFFFLGKECFILRRW